MSDPVDPVLPATRIGIAGLALLWHHLTANLCTELSPAFYSGYFHHVSHIPSRNNHHCTFHSPDYGEMASLLFLAEVHVSAAGWAAVLSFLRPGYCSRDFLFRVLLCRDLHCLGFRRLSQHGRDSSRHCY